MAQRKTLTERQVDVLRWIAEGCPAGFEDEHSARISAGALRNRDLVRTAGRGATWKATITTAGAEYLARVDGPHPPQPRQANVSVTQQLVDEVVAAGGSLRVPRKRWNVEGVDYARRAQLAEANGKVPAGSRLSVKSVSSDELEIQLLRDIRPSVKEVVEDGASGLAPIVVPERLGKPHRVAREFRDATDLHEISRKALPRADGVFHSLALEVERLGYSIECVQVRKDSYGRSEWKPARDGQLLVTINGHQLKVRVWEKGSGLRGRYEVEMERWREDRDQPVRLMQFLERPKPYDSAATGELNIAALGPSRGRQSSWGDRTRWTVEERLPNLLRELEIEAAEAEEARLAREREETERQRQWEVAMERAKQCFIEAHRLEVLRHRVATWQEADLIFSYCDAVVERHGEAAISDDPEAQQWLAFARERADAAQSLPRMPDEPETTPENLKPYLGRWSPYGPRGW
jgi:hypothetical protein